MKCHYEVLEVSRDADNAEIKSAYRKLALKWHPDKNLDDPDLAKEQFQVVQQAYEVLSDKQERAWYDAHRDQILRGASSEFQDKSLDVFQYFTTTCFKGYSDDEGGFYSVYGKVFQQLAEEDLEFMDKKEEFCQIPGFGRSDDDYEAVKGFYDFWMSYSTKKSYSWLDPYDIREGKGDRRLMKLIEKENKKARLKARQERNEEVRNLVAFVRKRDKRVQAFRKEIEAKTMENRKKQEQLSKQKRLERKEMHANEKQADWLKFDNVKSELEEIERHLAQEFGESEEEEEEEDLDSFYCAACNKIFKTPKAFQNHEISKKHKENVEKLREIMLEEDQDLVEEEDAEVSGEEQEEEEEVKEIKKKKNKKRPKVIKEDSFSEDSSITIRISDNEGEFDFNKGKSQKKKTKKPKPQENGDKKRDKKEKKVPHQTDQSEIDLSHCCATCKNSFPSKNKLFDHLKKTKHGVYLPPKVKQGSDKL